jgi:hypothetical protein
MKTLLLIISVIFSANSFAGVDEGIERYAVLNPFLPAF